MTSVVSNAGPLISLARIGQLDLLPKLYGEIIVPSAVYAEVTVTSYPGAEHLRSAEWLSVDEIEDTSAVQRLLFWLDLGESEAIVLAQRLEATVLMDERRGRAIAQAMELQVTGTVGVLLAAKTHGHILAVTPWLDALSIAGVRISARLYDDVRLLAGED